MSMLNRIVLCGALSAVAASASGAVLTEDFQDGDRTANPAWSALGGSTSAIISASGNNYLRFTSDAGRFTTPVDAIAPGEVITLSFKTMKGSGGNNIAVGFLDSTGTGIMFGNDLNSTSNINRVVVTSTTNSGASYTTIQGLTNIDASSSAGSGVWHSVQITWNTRTGAISAIIDGFDAGSATMTATIRTTDITQILIRNSYANSAYIDDISISIPEPASITVLGLSGLAVLARRR